MKRHMIIPIFIPHKGCPHDCIFCNQKSISGQLEEITEQKMRAVIETNLRYAGKDTFIEIAFYGGSFTGIEIEQQIRYLEIAHEYVKQNKVKEIRMSTRPDYISQEILDNLKKFNVGTIELGVQSMDDEVLRLSLRGHNVNDVLTSCSLIKRNGFRLGIQTMVGLPGDNREKSVETAKEIVELRPDIVRIYPALVVKNTYLYEMYKQGKYLPLTLDEAVDICAELLEIYEGHQINVIRIGLQPTENINDEGDVIAGPFHPAFRQLVESRLMLKRIETQIACKNLIDTENLIICVDNSNISNAVGQKKCNIVFLKKKYGYKSIKVVGASEPGISLEVSGGE
ncbi:MAG: radical SAM protein [Clostridia bacterium]|nr:radical SAM protein [Clostridia bacterium]